MRLVSEIKEGEYINGDTIIHILRRDCRKPQPHLSKLSFRAIYIEHKPETSPLGLFLVFRSADDKYVLRQEYRKFPARFPRRIVLHTACCLRHFPRSKPSAK